MPTYKYQLHTHTTPCSLCGAMTPTELCRALAENGYAGTVLTNHFYHGNSGIDRTLSWQDFVAAYEKDYLACKQAAEAYDLDILFGVEESVVPGLEILCYGLTPAVLYRHPELHHGRLDVWSRVMRENGVVVIQAHPYREASYIPEPGPLPVETIDGVEVYNRGNSTPEMNEKAVAFADAHPHLIRTSSADTHNTQTVPVGGIECPHRIRTEADLAKTLLSGDYTLILP
ncbi:MAG: PHP domain-containing protein [Clostridia bacterium]|nr:PHP domain-containing protein [Clostridia bacterium]